jgi:uncharacterized protein
MSDLASSEAVVEALVERYKLQPHPEGGFYVETFRSDVEVEVQVDDVAATTIRRPASTAIYFLITPGNVSDGQ